jgi:glycosyltransferase 2 family protein
MSKRLLNILVSLIVAGLFIWLAIRNIDAAVLWQQIRSVSLWWIPFFVVVMVFSHLLRAERWRLLIEKEKMNVPRSTLFAGVMMGYMFNNIVPRLGEVTRPVYVARQQKMSSGNLIGTIVIERLFDIVTMLMIMLFAILYLVTDIEAVQQLFGTEGWPWFVYFIIPGIVLIAGTGFWVAMKILNALENRADITNKILLRIVQAARSFSDGILSIRYIKSWPLFLIYTAGIWLAYVMMTFIPFFMMNLQAVYGLGMSDAVVLTIVSSIGVSIPTPAGIGSYHLLIQQSMWVFYQVPLVTALTYATVAHAVNLFSVFAVTPAALWWDKYNTLNNPQ